jgi:hypothetical protein
MKEGKYGSWAWPHNYLHKLILPKVKEPLNYFQGHQFNIRTRSQLSFHLIINMIQLPRVKIPLNREKRTESRSAVAGLPRYLGLTIGWEKSPLLYPFTRWLWHSTSAGIFLFIHLFIFVELPFSFLTS